MDAEVPTLKVVPDRADAGGPPAGDPTGGLEFARAAHLNFQEMVKLADQKAATIMAGTGLVVALLGGNLIDRFREAPWGGLGCVGAITLLLLLGAALHAMLVLLPRFPDGRDVAALAEAPGLMWGLSKFNGRPADYVQALATLTPAEALADVAYENLKITWVLEQKWMWMRGATRLSCCAFVTWAASVLLAAFGG